VHRVGLLAALIRSCGPDSHPAPDLLSGRHRFIHGLWCPLHTAAPTSGPCRLLPRRWYAAAGNSH